MKKICKMCKKELDISFFSKKIGGKFGVRTTCKECIKITEKEYRKNNKKKIRQYYLRNKERIKKAHKEYYKNNKEEINKRNKQYYLKNKDHLHQCCMRYRKKNKEKRNFQERKRKKEDPVYKLSHNIRNRIHRAFKNILHTHKNKHTFEIIGLSSKETKEYIERQFKPGMTWDNYGLFGWHIDHILPLSMAKTEEEMYKLCHYTNLQPLWAKENLSKQNKISLIIKKGE